MEFITNDQCTLYYEVYGEGESLMLLHGNGEDGTYFEHQIAYFKEFYQVLVVDMRGHGKSGYNQVELNFTVFASDVIALMDERCIQKAHVLGFSDGGNTAIAMAMNYPERMLSLIANGADLHPSGVLRRYQIPICMGYALLCMFPKKYVYQKQQIMNLMVHHPNVEPISLHAITCPTLVLVGHKDMIQEAHSKLIAQHIHNAHYVVIKGNHFIAQSNPLAYNEVVHTFLQACATQH